LYAEVQQSMVLAISQLVMPTNCCIQNVYKNIKVSEEPLQYCTYFTSPSQHQVARPTNKNSSILGHHSRVNESEMSIQVPDDTLPALATKSCNTYK